MAADDTPHPEKRSRAAAKTPPPPATKKAPQSERESLDEKVKAVAEQLGGKDRVDAAEAADLAVKAVGGDGDKHAAKVALAIESSAFRDDPQIVARLAVETAAALCP